MRLGDFPLLTDENIHPAVVDELRAMGCDVQAVRENGWAGSGRPDPGRRARSLSRVVVTHDRDFGALSVARLEPMVGIVFCGRAISILNSPFKRCDCCSPRVLILRAIYFGCETHERRRNHSHEESIIVPRVQARTLLPLLDGFAS